MQYLRSLQFIMDRKNWLTNVLMGGLSMLVPIIGPIVFTGYLFEVIDALKRDPEHKDYPDFDFNRLMEYLTRGAWPFLMQLVVSLIIALPLGLFMGVVMVVGIALAANSNSPAILVVFQLLMFVVILVVSVLSVFVTFPAELQAGLGREFNFARMVAFVKEFNKLVFKELLVSVLFLVAIAFVAEFVGMAIFCVGIYFTMAAVVMAQHHLEFQLYQLYLERGGTPVVAAGSASSRAESRTDMPYPAEPIEPEERFRGER